MTANAHRSGFVAVVGRPNVGKSTLVNALVGHKISIVTAKPHTTRHAILGILTEPGFQLAFIDTPGLESQLKKLVNRAMNKAAVGAVEGAELILFVVEGGRWQAADDHVLEIIERSGLPCLVAVNKVDQVKPKERLLPFLQTLAEKFPFAEIVPLSALRQQNIELLKELLVQKLPEEPAMFPEAMVTDKSARFRAAEILREKLMHTLRQEVPYGLAVEINEFDQDAEVIGIDAIIWVDRESHKGIVVGKGGQGLKSVGQAARLDMQVAFDKRVRLDTRVKLKKNWSDNAQAIQQFGYDPEL